MNSDSLRSMDSSMSNSCPNLPGFRSNNPGSVKKTGPRSKIIHGIMIDQSCAVPRPKRELCIKPENSSNLYQESLKKSGSTPSKVAGYIANANMVLSFKCYFKESVLEAATGENCRVRKCEMFYYVEDDTICIIEHKQENSGVPQGNLIKRHLIEQDGRPIMLEDIVSGNALTLYGKTFMLCGCNGSTTDYLKNNGYPAVSQDGYPSDQFEDSRAEFMQRETGADFTVSRNALKNPMKKHMEASLGNTVNNTGLESFLKYDRVVLRFDALWDDSKAMYGEVKQYKVIFYLANGQAEILEVAKPNSGCDPFPKLLSKRKLPKSWGTSDANGRADEDNDENYSWDDFHIGDTINVFARELQLVDADGATRRFYEDKGMPLGAPILIPRNGAAKVAAKVPEYNGWGSQEDSLASCLSLVPKPPKTPFDVVGPALSKQLLRFQAEMTDTKFSEDQGRKFVITFYLDDNSFAVREPPQRNTGVIGGNFLARKKYMNADTGKLFEYTAFYVGALVTVNGSTFIVKDVDEATLKYMEGQPREFPMSDVHKVLADLRDKLLEEGRSMTDVFRRHDKDHSGTISLAEFKGMVSGLADMSEQMVITLMRHFDRTGDGLVNQDEFVSAVEGVGVGRKSSDPWVDLSADDGKNYKAKAEEQAAQEALKTKQDMLVYHFTEKLLSSGTISQHLVRIAGHHGATDISRNIFIRGISAAKDQSDSDSDTIYFPQDQAALIADKVFAKATKKHQDGSVQLSVSEFSNIVSHLSLEAGRLGHGS